MKYLKAYESFEPESSSTFNIVVTSKVEDDQKNDLQSVINLYYDEDYQEVNNELKGKMRSSQSYVGVGKWQIDKSQEIESKFFDNIKINGNQVISKFSVELPSDWDRGTIIEWVDGFHEYKRILPLLTIEKLSKKKDHEYLDSYNDIIKTLSKNNRIDYEVSK